MYTMKDVPYHDDLELLRTILKDVEHIFKAAKKKHMYATALRAKELLAKYGQQFFEKESRRFQWGNLSESDLKTLIELAKRQKNEKEL